MFSILLIVLFFSLFQLYLVLKGPLPPKDLEAKARVTEGNEESEEEEDEGEAAEAATAVEEEEWVMDPLPQSTVPATKTRLQKRKAGESRETPGSEDGDSDDEAEPTSKKVVTPPKKKANTNEPAKPAPKAKAKTSKPEAKRATAAS